MHNSTKPASEIIRIKFPMKYPRDSNEISNEIPRYSNEIPNEISQV
jgi:hypothetical protein